MSGHMPKSSGGALVQCIVSILIGVVILGIGAYGWILPYIEHKDWVEVTVAQVDSDCHTTICYGSKGRRYSCQKCTRDYKYEYEGRTITGKDYYESPSEGKTIKALIDPHKPGKPYHKPSWWLFALEVLLSLGAFGFAWMFASIHRSYKSLEDLGRQDLVQKLAEGKTIDEKDIYG